MALQEGRNAGVTGLLDLPGQSAKFEGQARGFSTELNAALIDAAGRGDSEWPEQRPGSSGGFATVSGLVRLDAFPIPDKYRGEKGTLTLTQSGAAKLTLTVRVVKSTFLKSDKEQGLWQFTHVCQYVDAPAAAGFGDTQPTADTETFDDKELWAGLSKTVDPNGLQSAAGQRWILWGVGDSDSDEKTYVDGVLTALSAPFTGMKLRIGTFTRASKNAAYIDIQWGLTDTAEDVTNPLTKTTEDPNDIGNAASVATINSTPATPAGYSDRGTTTQELNDAHTLYVKEAGVRSRLEDVTQEGTNTNADVASLADDARITLVTDTSTVPATPDAPVGQLLAIVSQQFQSTPEKWRHTFLYGNTTSAQKLTFPESPVDADPTTIRDQDQQSILNTSSTPPATPDPRTADLQMRRRTSVRVSGTPEQWQHTFYFARNTVKDEIEIQGANETTDPNDIGETAVVRRVTNSETPPSAPAAPVGQLVETTTEPLTVATGAYSGYWVHTFRYGPTTRLQEIQFKGELNVDPSQIKDSDTIPVVANSSTPPATPTPGTADLQLVRRRAQRIQGTPEKWVHTFEFGRNTAEDDVETDATSTSADPDDFDEKARIGAVHTSETPPATPAAPVGQLVGIDTRPLTVPSGTYTGLWLHTFIYGATTRKQAIEQEGGVEVDAASLEGSDVQVLTNTSSTPPATPATNVAGLVLRFRRSRKVQNTPEKWRHEFVFGPRTTKQDIELPGTVKRDDQSDLRDSATVTKVTATSTPPSTPAAPVGKLVSIDSEQINDAGAWKWVYRYANNSPKDEIEFDGTELEEDGGVLDGTLTAGGLTDNGRQTYVRDSSAWISPLPDPPLNGLYLRGYSIKQIGSTPEKWKHTLTWGIRSSVQDITLPGTVTTDETSDLGDDAIVTLVNTSSTPPATPAAPVGQFLSRTSECLRSYDDGGTLTETWRHAFKYGNTTEAQRRTFAKASTDTDASGLKSEDTKSEITTSSTPPTTPTPEPSTLVLRTTSTQRIGGTPAQYQHTWFFGLRTTQQDIEYLQSKSVAEASNLEKREIVTKVTSSSTPDSTGLNPDSTNLSLYWSDSHQETSTGKWVHTFEFRPLTADEAMTAQFQADDVDPDLLEDESTRVLYNSTSTPDAAPSVSGKVHVGTNVRRVGKAKYRYIYRYGYRTSAGKLEADKTRATTDPSDIESESLTADVWLVSGGAPSDPSAPSGLKLAEKTDVEIQNPLYRLRIYRWSKQTTADRLTNPHHWDQVDPSSIEDKAERAALNGTPSNDTGLQVRATRTQTVNDDNDLTVVEYGRNTPQEDREFDATLASADPMGVFQRRTASIVSYSGTAADLADSLLSSNMADSTFDGVEVKKVTPDLALQIIKTSGDDKTLHSGHGHAFRDVVRGVPLTALPSFVSPTNPGAYNPGNISVSDTQAKVFIYYNGGNLVARPMYIYRSVGGFTFRRIFTAFRSSGDTGYSAGPPADPIWTDYQYLSLRGTCNNATFLGFGAGEVMYAGPSAAYSFSVDGKHRLIMDYLFVTDNWKFFNDGYLPEGYCAVNSGSISSSGLYNATQLDSGLVCTFPAQSTFSGFIT